MTMKSILERNLEVLTGYGKGTMLHAQGESRESMGGSAYQGFPCSGANFYYDGATGEIKYFGNAQDVPAEVKKYHSGTLQIAWMSNRVLIVALMTDSLPNRISNRLCGLVKEPSKEAIKTLEETVKKYNELEKK